MEAALLTQVRRGRRSQKWRGVCCVPRLAVASTQVNETAVKGPDLDGGEADQITSDGSDVQWRREGALEVRREGWRMNKDACQ